MQPSIQFLKPVDAARQLGVSAKALRLYEQRGLVTPGRTSAGWRTYGPDDMARGREIVALRALGLSLGDIGRVLAGKVWQLEPVLAAHQAVLESRIQGATEAIERIRALRADLAEGRRPSIAELTLALGAESRPGVAFDLPWPWGGERFELDSIRPLTFIVGPLGSGKTRLAMRLAETLPNAVFLGPDRLDDDGAAALARIDAEPVLRAQIDCALAWLIEDGAVHSNALLALLAGLYAPGASVVVVDMVEQGLDHATQEAMIAYLRRGDDGIPPLFLMTRSSAMLDLGAVGPGEAILFCPANHSPPTLVAPYPGAAGYEALASCLASPEVRARTAGVVVVRPEVA